MRTASAPTTRLALVRKPQAQMAHYFRGGALSGAKRPLQLGGPIVSSAARYVGADYLFPDLRAAFGALLGGGGAVFAGAEAFAATAGAGRRRPWTSFQITTIGAAT